MIAALYTQGKGLRFGDAAVPTIGDDELLVRVEGTAICGTDVKIVHHGHRKLRDGQTIILGHEFVGVIERVGVRVTGWRAGQRVGVAPNMGCGHCEMCARGLGNMCPDYSAFGIDRDGSHTELVRIPAAALAQNLVIALPPEVRPQDGALAEPLSCAVNGIRNARVADGDRVVVYGAGPMGLLNMMLAAVSGATEVIAVDLDDARLELAAKLGATATVNSKRQPVPQWVKEHTRGRGVDAVICAVPVPQLQQEALGILAPFGRLCLFAGWPKGTAGVPLDTNPIHYKNLVVTGMTGGCASDYATALRLIAERKINIAAVVSDVFPLSRIEDAYAAALSGKRMKVVLVSEAGA